MTDGPIRQGACLCGAVRLQITGPVEAPDACHCTQCRKMTGHFWASVDVARTDLDVTGEVRWYKSSEKVERGFCPTCGSTLFWAPIGRDWLAVSMGALDAPTDLHLGKHIFTAEKGDYYDIADGLPQETAPP